MLIYDIREKKSLYIRGIYPFGAFGFEEFRKPKETFSWGPFLRLGPLLSVCSLNVGFLDDAGPVGWYTGSTV